MDLFSPAVLTLLFQVVAINVVLSGDNAIVIGMAAAGLPRDMRAKVILIGIAAATVLRVIFAVVAVELLEITGLLLAGGLLLLWICWKMWRELRDSHAAPDCTPNVGDDNSFAPGRKSFTAAAWQIVVADVSMSLDNVLAMAGASRDHPMVLIFGLILSVVLMGLAANLVANLLNRFRWLGYVGLVIILFVALEMIWRGLLDVAPVVTASLG
ncbi:MAG: TerC family protein [bacterium]